MNANRLGRLVVAVAIVVAVSSVRAAPVGTGFTYQGQLKEGGSPPSGLYDLRFSLFDASAGGAPVGAAFCVNNVTVTNGLFTVALDFGSQFNGDQRFLEVELRVDTGLVCANLAGFVILSPRQALTTTPYALGLRLPFSQITATDSDVFNITSTGGGDGFQFNISNPASVAEALEGRTNGAGDSVQGINTGTGRAGLFQIDNAANNSAALYATTNGSGPAMVAVGKVGIGTTAPAERLHIVGGTDTAPASGGYLVVGSIASANISIDNNEIMARSNGATDTLALNAAGGNVTLIQSGTGRVGIGTTAPGHLLDVGGRMRVREGSSTAGIWLYQTTPAADRAFVGMYDDDTFGLYGNTGAGWSLLMDTTTGNVGIDTTAPEAKLHIVNGSDSEPTGGGFLVTGSTTGLNISIDNNEIMARNNGATATLFLNNDGGTVSVPVLAITGADLAEKFPVSEKVDAGMVVEIDTDKPGQLRLSQGAYNRRVAGVVSGANGLATGAILGNLPGHEDAPAIALSGRVWVHCDASNGPIEPGDLLTTSDTPGHAMKMSDFAKGQGAILGKAMTGLKNGETGLVLTLISLQ